MAEELKDYILSNPPSGDFEPRPYYSAIGNFLAYHWGNDDYFAHRESDLLTIYLSMKTRKPVGLKIKGVSQIMNNFGSFFSSEAKTRPSLGSLVLACRALAQQDISEMESDYLELVGEKTRDVPLNVEELECEYA